MELWDAYDENRKPLGYNVEKKNVSALLLKGLIGKGDIHTFRCKGL